MNATSISWSNGLAAIAASILAVCVAAASASAAPYATGWITGHHFKARLIIGGAPGEGGAVVRYAAVELSLDPGWKTYWRQPGSAGGIPPHFDWAGSTNVTSIDVLYPAPTRMTDPTGLIIGYKNSVIFPIRLELVDPSKPVSLDIKAFFGVCRDICIPASAQFKVSPPPQLFLQTPVELADALDRLPRPAGPGVAGVPRLAKVSSSKGPAPTTHALTIDIAYPGAIDHTDLFAETGDQQPLPMTTIVRRAGNTVRYRLVLDAQEWHAVGKTGLLLTMVAPGAAGYQLVARP